jgi:hypothetical protein
MEMRWGAKRFFYALLIGLIIISLPSRARAYSPPPGKLIDQKISPFCVKAELYYLTGQPLGWGTGGKGPAVQLKNNCSSEIVISEIRIGNDKTDMQLAPQIDAQVTILDGEVVRYRKYLFSATDEGCKAAAETIKKVNEQEMKEDEERQKIREQNKWADMAGALLGWVERPRTDTEFTALACKNLLIPANGTLAIGSPWNTRYAIFGHSVTSNESSDSFDISAEGKMINPRDPESPDAVKLAEDGDNKVRHELAVRCLDLKRDYNKAMRWLQAAAAEGYGPSQHQLATCYSLGSCKVTKNLEEGLFWYYLIANDKDGYMTKKRNEVEVELSPEQIKAVKERVEKWKKTHPATKWQ